MTLEDFFTLTEIKDGLSVPSRVHELVSVMQKEKDTVLKNIGDAIRQWAAVATTIAATENKDCLDQFIQLDGLLFIDRWLKNAQSFETDASDCLIEESVIALLRALEKLQIDKERSIASGIWITVNSLLDHSSSRIQDRARSVFNGWKQGNINDTISCDNQSVEGQDDTNITSGSSKAEGDAVDAVFSIGKTDVESKATDSEAAKTLQSEGFQSTSNEQMKVETNGKDLLPSKFPDHGNTEERASDTFTTLIVCNSNLENLFPFRTSVMSAGGNSSPHTEDYEMSSRHLEDSNKTSNSPDRSGVRASVSTRVELGAISPGVQEDGAGTSLQMSGGVGDRDVDASDMLRDFSSAGKKFKKSEYSELGIREANDEYSDRSSDGASDASESSDFAEPATFTRVSNQNDARSDNDLEDGIIDALQLARQVALEVEREVEDQREPSCSSSSEDCMDTDVGMPGTPDSIDGKPDTYGDMPSDTPRQSQSAEACSEREGPLINSDNQNDGSKASIQKDDSSQLTEMDQELEGGKEPCGFDLNQEFLTDEADYHVNSVSTPSVVSASKPVAASASPGVPLQFEGALGWRGSATTSAFRPASPRKIADDDKNLETGGSSSSSKQRQGFLDIDLNVAEDGYEKITNIMMKRRLSICSGVHSSASSLEVGTKRLGTPNLDLNRIMDDNYAPPADSRISHHLFYPRNYQRSPSPVSSSPSVQPSLLRNFDLNDKPLFLNDSLDQGLYHGKSSQNANAYEARLGDPVISIMGTKVEVGNKVETGRKDFIAQAPSSNGKPFDQEVNANMARMGGFLGMTPPVTYVHSPVFGYNGLTTGPTLSMSQVIYGPGGSIPYMVDSRGAPVMPQFMGSASPIPTCTHQPPFIMSMTGTQGLSGAGPSGPSVDVNSGFAVDGGNAGGLRQLQLFMPGQARSVEDWRANSQPFLGTGVVGGKRKMPDGGREPYSSHFKHTQPP